ncbi:MAG TPA: hypothetical protein VL096_21120, partial [Pirellulaceae bacterium]|nr:hypothetical protein [Pirellulaceae bacterium]
MLDFLAGCLAFLLFVAVWAAIGHGIWVLVAKIGSSLFGAAPETRQRTPETLTNEIQGTLRQLERLWRRGLITDEEQARLRAACQRDLDRLNGAAPATPAAPPIKSAITYIAPPVAPEIAIVEAEIVNAETRRALAPPPLAVPRTPTPAVHPLDRPDDVVPPTPVAPPQARRALADVLAAFMQSRNIRWGELVSGLLIVGSAAGLVLSLRDRLQAWIPYFPAFLFLLGTAAMHSAGLYTLRKWNLQSTSRGVLLITMLLVPLNFLAAILISGDDAQHIPVASWSYLLAITVGLLAYGTITYTGAHALVGRTWPALALAVFGTSIPLLAINRLIHADSSPARLLLLGGSAAVTFMLGIVWCVVVGRHWTRLSLRRAQPLLMTLGLGGFAFVLPLILLIGKSERVWFSLAQLTPIFALLGATIITAGVFITQRTHARQLGALATTGTTLAILGGLVMLLAIGFSWPEPPRLITVGLLCAITLTGQSFLGRTAALQIPAITCATMTLLVGFHTWQGSYAGDDGELSIRLLQTFVMGRSALVLTAIAAAVMAYAGVLWKYRLRDHAMYLIASATGLMGLSLSVAAYAGFWPGEDAALATWVFAIYATALTIATFVRQHRAITVAASLLWLVVSIHAYGFNEPLRAWLIAHEWLPERPVLLATIVHAVNAALAALALAWFDRSNKWRSEVIEPLAVVAFGVSLATLLFIIPTQEHQYALHAGYLSAIAATWLSAALLLRSQQLTTAAQTLSTLTAAYVAVAMSQQFGQTTSWAEPRWIAVLLAVVAWSALWPFTRRISERWPSIHVLLAPPWPKCDQVVLLSAVVVALLMTFTAVAVGIAHEMGAKSPTQIAEELVWLQARCTPLCWITLAAIAIAACGAFWERRELPWIVALLLVMLTGVGLVALGFAEQIAIASALRWGLAGFLLIMLPILCARRRLATAFDKLPLGWRGDWPDYTGEVSIATTLVGAALPIVLVTLFACAQAA